MKTNEKILAVDIGGTKIAVGIISKDGKIAHRRVAPSRAAKGKDALLGVLGDLVDSLLTEVSDPVCCIGIGTAGEVDHRLGIITSATDAIPGWAGTALGAWCQDRWSLPCYVDNDGNAQGLGEAIFGAGQGFRDFVYVCLGTGIGGAVIVNGELVRGKNNIAGAIGHVLVVMDGERCSCGQSGCLEAYVSGSAMDRCAISLGLKDGRALVQAGIQGDREAVAAWNRFGTYFGTGLASVVHILNPEAILVGGGAAAAGELLWKPTREVLEKRLLPGLRGSVTIQRASLGDDAGLLGAAAVALARVCP